MYMVRTLALIALLLIVNLGFSQDIKIGIRTGHAERIVHAEFSPDEQMLLTIADDREAWLWNVETGNKLMRLGEGQIYDANFSSSGKYILFISGQSYDYTVSLFDVALLRIAIKVKVVHGSIKTQISQDENKLLIGYGIRAVDSVQVYDLRRLKHVLTLPQGDPEDYNPSSFTTHKNMFHSSKDLLVFWNEKEGIVQKGIFTDVLISKSKGNYCSVYYTADSKCILVKDHYSGDVKLLESVSMSEITSCASAIMVKVSPNDRFLVEVDSSGVLRVFDLDIKEWSTSFSDLPPLSTYCEIQFDKEGELFLLKTSSDSIYVVDIANRSVVNETSKLQNSYGYGYKLFGGGRYVMSLGSVYDRYTDTTIHLFGSETATGQFFSENLIFLSSGNEGRIFSLSDFHVISEIKAAHSSFQNVNSLFLKDHTIVETTDDGKHSNIWKLKTGLSGSQPLGLAEDQRISHSSISPNQRYIALTNKDKTIRVLDLNERDKALEIEDFIGSSNLKANFSKDNNYLIIQHYSDFSSNWNCAMVNLDSWSKASIVTLQKSWTTEGSVLASWLRSGYFDYDMFGVTNAGGLENSIVQQGIDWVVRNKDGLNEVTPGSQDLGYLSMPDTLIKLQSGINGYANPLNHLTISPDQKYILGYGKKGKLTVWLYGSDSLIAQFEGNGGDCIGGKYSTDGNYHISFYQGGQVMLLDMSKLSVVTTVILESDATDAIFIPKDSILLITTNLGQTYVYNLKGEVLVQRVIFDFDPSKWVHIHPSGLFDASPEAMELMYWTKGLEVIEFDQLKDRYWLPGLWEKVMSGEALPDVRDIGKLKLQPEVRLGTVKDGKLPITLKKREGGYGKVSVFINGKEVSGDARGESLDTSQTSQTLYFSIKDHPYLIAGNNQITVKASSADGFVQGRGVSIDEYVDETDVVSPSFYGVVIGVSDYANDAIDLVYPEKDAEVISKSLKQAADNFFLPLGGTSEVYTLSTANSTLPTKENIRMVFKKISSKAKAEDVIFVYLSGHGITYGSEEGSDFYFLTTDATAASKEAYTDPQIRASRTISTNELVEWIKEIPALKQVMIIDACGAGKAVDNLIAARDVDASQIKAMDRMKDRTGMFVISGCAADAVSYEASQYGQGLLTYAILEGMSGAALKQGEFVDVLKLMDHARERVPKLAEGIGGIQTPQLLIPKGGSFDVGKLSEEQQKAIPLAQPKTIYVRSTMVNAKKGFRDTEGIGQLLDKALDNKAAEGASYIFFDAYEYRQACQISGGYTVSEGSITAEITIHCVDNESSFTVEATSKEALIQKIIEQIQ